MQTSLLEKNGSETTRINWYKWGFIVAAALLIGILFGKKDATVSYVPFLATGGVILAIYFYSEWLKAQKNPSFDKLAKESARLAKKEGVFLLTSPFNVVGQPIGKDLIAVRFLMENLTFLFFEGRYVGNTKQSLGEIIDQNQRSDTLRILAQKGLLTPEEA